MLEDLFLLPTNHLAFLVMLINLLLLAVRAVPFALVDLYLLQTKLSACHAMLISLLLLAVLHAPFVQEGQFPLMTDHPAFHAMRLNLLTGTHSAGCSKCLPSLLEAVHAAVCDP